MLGQRQLTPGEYLDVLRRRKTYLLIFLFLGPSLAFGLTLVLPAKYTSSTLVLVEQPRVPESIIKPVVNDALNQRLSSMQEQILSRTRLQPLIERFNLYHSDKEKMPMEDMVALMRKNINVTPIRPVAGTQMEAILPGFTIAFTYEDPKAAQLVCSEITSMFIEENLKHRQERSQGTTDFLVKQLEDAKRSLDDQDARLADFQRRYIGQLPGNEQTNMQFLLSLNGQLEAVTSLLNRAQQDKAFTESLLAQQLAAWEASQASGAASPQTLEQQLTQMQTQLVTLEGRYTSDHPDVIKLKADIAQVKKKMAEAENQEPDKKTAPTQKASLSEPPQIFQLRNQIHQLTQTLEEKTREQQHLQEQIKVYQARVQLSPMVEEQFKTLNRDYQTASNFYNDLLAKKTQSEMATDLERRQQGEQFRVMDPANLPETASFPDPIKFTLGGLVGGLGIGLALAVFTEMKDKVLRNERDIEFFLELPTLAMLPLAEAQAAQKKSGFWKSRKKRGSQELTLGAGA
jgi:polysaccharide chain length determinant protein (PEP-CTERM system associated)